MSERGSSAEQQDGYGFASVAAYLDHCSGFEVTKYEPVSETSLDFGPLRCSSDDMMTGKRTLFGALENDPALGAFDYLEFGVRDCATFNAMMARHPHPDARFWGFDTFTGLPEDWVQEWGGHPRRLGRARGELSPTLPPSVFDRRATLFPGLFQETLPEALTRIFPSGRDPGRTLFINVDCDIYSGALYILARLHDYLRPGDFLYFDEFFDTLNEFAAFNDYVRSHYVRDDFVPVARAYDAMLMRYRPEAQAMRPAPPIRYESTPMALRLAASAITKVRTAFRL